MLRMTIAVWLILVTVAHAQIAVVSSTSAGANNGATSTVTTSGINTTSANFVVVALSWYGSTAPTLSDSQTLSWTHLTKASYSVTRNARISYATVTSSNASHTFTAGQAGSYPSIAVYALSGVDTASAADQLSNNNGGAAITSIQPGSITPSVDGCFVITGISGITSDPTVSSPFDTNLVKVNYVASQHLMLGVSYEIQTSATARNPTWTTASDSLAATIASFKPASGGGSANSYYYQQNQ